MSKTYPYRMGLMSILIFLSLVAAVPYIHGFQSEDGLEITYPVKGSVLKGLININGTSAINGFKNSEIAFAYTLSSQDNWFTIILSHEPISKGILGTWDTSKISDGDYQLRIIVHAEDGTKQELIITNLFVRNYSPTPTLISSIKPVATDMLFPTNPSLRVVQVRTPTRLPENPVEISPKKFMTSSVIGGGSILFVILMVMIFGYFKKSAKGE